MAVLELPKEGATIERGTPVTVTGIFSDDPTEVHASFMKPGQARAIVDPGFGKKGSRIRRLDRGVYTYVIDTTGFSPGKVEWHIWSPCDSSDFGWFTINDRPPQLL